MKIKAKIVFLFLALGGLIAFGVAPAINKGQDTQYVRYYEDVDMKVSSNKKISRQVATKKDTTVKNHNKVYKKETIAPARTRRVSMKQFSRAIQFEPVVDTMLLKQDTLAVQ